MASTVQGRWNADAKQRNTAAGMIKAEERANQYETARQNQYQAGVRLGQAEHDSNKLFGETVKDLNLSDTDMRSRRTAWSQNFKNDNRELIDSHNRYSEELAGYNSMGDQRLNDHKRASRGESFFNWW